MNDVPRKTEHIRWLKRFRPPAIFASLGAACHSLITLYGESWPILTNITGPLSVLGTILIVISVGWAVGTIVDGLLKRQLSRLNTNQPNNLKARKAATRLDVIRRIWMVLVAVFTLATALTTIPGVRQIGVSILASAGIAGLAIGLAARPVLSNLIAGLQIAFTQPIRIDDAVVIENEWGWIEEIGLFYVTVKIWDWRRLVIPLSYFIEKPFQNWTRESATIIGSVFWSLDYQAPIREIRKKLEAICRSTELWDGNVVNLQVSESQGTTLTIRALASARTSPEAWDLRCLIREEMIIWLQENYPESLPRMRLETSERAHSGKTG